MENKRTCKYCGTIYSGALNKCPLCGSAAESPPSTAPNAPQERSGYVSPRRRKKDENAVPKDFLVATVVFLSMAVVAVLFFIGDMIGWWPGFEDRIDRTPTSTAASDDVRCTHLNVMPETQELVFTHIGQTQEITVAVNLTCNEEIAVVSADEAVLSVAAKTPTPTEGIELKSQAFVVTALTSGETTLTVSCGEKSKSYRIVCTLEDTPAPSDTTQAPTDASTEPEPSSEEPTETDVEPKLNYEDVSMFSAGETCVLKVTNAPDGAQITWRSEDETVAKVNADGVVTAVGKGTTSIVASMNGKEAEMIVRCRFEGTAFVGNESLNYTDVTLKVGESFYLNLYDAEDNRIRDVTYSCDDGSICAMDGNEITALASGTANVTVTYNGNSYTCIVRVR